MLRVLVVDDQDLFRAGFALILNAQPDIEVVGEALLAPSVTRRLIADLAGRGHPVPKLAARLDDLTERERDTLRQLARGLSNAEIARELYVSEHTVKTHVSNVLAKLGLRDRA